MLTLHKYLILLIPILARPAAGLCQCTALGPQNGSVFSNNTSVGSVAWATPANTGSSDNLYTGAGSLLGILASAQTNYMLCTGFSFSVPVTASICGIKVDVERNAAGLLIGSSVTDNRVMIVKNGVIGGTNHASGAGWTGTDAMASYGSNADTWGLAWTPADVNSPNFGIALSATLNAGLASLFLTANVDYVRVTVYYDNTTLPIGVSALQGFVEPGRNRLQWSTLSENSGDYFSLQKMNGSGSWNELEQVQASARPVYEAYDTSVKDMSYYRVRQVSAAGNDSYSEVIAVKGAVAEPAGLLLYPVPADDCLYLQAPDPIEAISLYDAWHMQQPACLIPGHVPHIDISQLPAGIYVVKVSTKNRDYIKKFIKN